MKTKLTSENSSGFHNAKRAFAFCLLILAAACEHADRSPGLSGTLEPEEQSYPKAITVVSDLPNVAYLTSGSQYSCAVTEGGSAYCWGSNEIGQFGSDTPQIATAPVLVQAGPSSVYSNFSSGGRQNCFVTAGENELYCMGDFLLQGVDIIRSTAPFQITSLSHIEEIGVGGQFDCALLRGGDIRCWFIYENVDQNRLEYAYLIPSTKATDISNGGLHGCAVTFLQKVVCWGYDGNHLGPQWEVAPQRGLYIGSAYTLDGVSAIDLALWEVPLPSPAVSVAVSTDISCAITVSGELFCWGKNRFGQLGNGSVSTEGSSSPAKVALSEKVRRVVVGGPISCALTENDRTYCWGFWIFDDAEGCLAQYPRLPEACYRKRPVLAPSVMQGAKQISLMSTALCYIAKDGKVGCLGTNDKGQLGRGVRESEISR